ncbi:PepSY domain-containing protein [Rhodopseudomonas sp. HC1]|uniref:PepSY-associated TM helix domain-containing protein n=1 Tax=Rhodopseudomonas infernalis TaxID=2897386 RepID=UPI001EE7F6BE|nr:PepSY-associated TM helix domain-containing protein [Rhodopseudomonas infernalis]MCG6204591.1 PepSY domain-containing protein [Rhodopseudomonas infernalis]
MTKRSDHAARLSARRIWRALHLLLALTVGTGLALIGASGALLVLKEPLVALEVGREIVKPPHIAGRPDAGADVWIARASERYPELKVIGANAPGTGFLPGDAAIVFGRLPEGDLGVVFVQRQSGEPLGLFAFDRSWFAAAVNLHRRLLLPGPLGASVVGCCGVALALSLLSGAYLWWPRQRKWWRSLWIGGSAAGQRRLIEWHGVSAAYLLAPLLVLATTGLALTKPQWLGLSGAAPTKSVSGRSAAIVCPAGSDLRGALAAAALAHPDAEIVGVLLPRGPDGAYQVNMRSPSSRRGDLAIAVRTGCTSPVVEAADTVPALRRDWLSPLHADLRLGLPGSIIVLLCGIALPTLYLTGLWLWLARRRRRRDR